MNKLWAVIRREYLAKVRTKAFIVGTILGPILMAGLFVLPVLMDQPSSTRRIGVVDAAGGQLGNRVVRVLEEARIGEGAESRPRYMVVRVDGHDDPNRIRDSLVARTGVSDSTDDLDGFLVVTEASLDSSEVTYYGVNAGSFSDMAALENVLEPVFLSEKLERRGVPLELVADVRGGLDLDGAKVVAGSLTGESGEASFMLSYIMAFVLYIALLLYGIQVMTSVLEEKNSRIMEVLASSLTPFQLLLGKVVGVGAAGITQLGIWIGAAMLITANIAAIVGTFTGGVPAESAGAGMSAPLISPGLLVVFLLFFLVGFFLYAAAYAAIGAMTNSVQEAQQSATIVNIFIVVGFLSIFSLLSDAGSTTARILSLIPFFAPMVVPVRYSVSPLPLPEVALYLTLTVLG
ncbi:MAG: ABC transporter permease, partial [Gemmatimonadales bacterium]